jgi:ankyrin repeat protein
VSNKHNATLINQFIEALLEKGADVSAPDHEGITELFDQLDSLPSAHHSKCLFVLFIGRTALHAASTKGDSETVLLLLKKGRPLVNAYDQWGNTPLLCALNGRHEDTSSLLLENSSRIDIRDEQGTRSPPLIIAASVASC